MLIALFFTQAREKENPAPIPEIKAGNYDNLFIKFYNSTLVGGNHNPKAFNFDLDKNGYR